MTQSHTTGLRSWLVYPYSLTDRLIQKVGEASLQVLAQGFARATADERLWCREILISAKGDACWYARTTAPEITYNNCQDFFEALKSKSLGELIFNSSMVQRASLAHYPIGAVASQYQWLPISIKPIPAQALWVRASHFRLHGQYPFDLIEIFLPAMQRYCE